MGTVNTLVITGYGTNSHMETAHTARLAGADKADVVHFSDLVAAKVRLADYHFLVFPGGFLDGDDLGAAQAAAMRWRYLKDDAGAALLQSLREFLDEGKLILGICNGFQVLTEAHLLPGALLSNTSLTFICRKCHVRVESNDNMFTSSYNKGDILQFPIAHHEGLYFLTENELRELEDSGRVVFRYADPATGAAGAEYAPNGALNGIAGICNKEGNILGLMPHPERATIAHLNGGSDGASFWKSIAKAFAERGGF